MALNVTVIFLFGITTISVFNTVKIILKYFLLTTHFIIYKDAS